MPAGNAARVDGDIGKNAIVAQIIRELLGVEPREMRNYDRLQIRADERVQSRLDRHTAPRHMVESFKFMMATSEFPNMVVTEDGVIVDGNTRDKAYHARNVRYVPAFIVPIRYDASDEQTRARMEYCSAKINKLNGLTIDATETDMMILRGIGMGLTDDVISFDAGKDVTHVRKLREQHNAKDRLRVLGIDPEGIKKEVVQAFGRTAAMRLGDEPYRQLWELTDDAGLNAGQVKALTGSLTEAATPELQVERINHNRDALEPQITARAHGRNIPKYAGRLRGWAKIFVRNSREAFVENNVEERDEHLQLIDQFIVGLQEVKAIMEAETPPAPGPLGAAQQRAAARPQ